MGKNKNKKEWRPIGYEDSGSLGISSRLSNTVTVFPGIRLCLSIAYEAGLLWVTFGYMFCLTLEL